MAAVMLSFFGRFTTEELTQIRMKDTTKHLYDVMQESDDEKVVQFLKQLDSFREKAERYPVSDVLWELMYDTGYYHYAGTMPAGTQRQANLDMLYTKAAAFEKTSYSGLFQFLRYIERLKKYEVDFAEASVLGENENLVRVMSIHKSKGLEFPVVFMPGMEDGLFPGWRSLDSADGVEEERRLCYVGITRARERLYLTSAVARTIYGRTDFTRESQFLKELDRDLFDEEADPIGKNSYQEGGGNIEAKPKKQYGAMNKPFDQLKYIRQSTSELAKTASESKEDFGDGDRVSHPKFGEGLVISVKGGAVTVAFDSVGIKKLALDFAPLKKI